MTRTTCRALLTAVLTLAATAQADWPRWRGPNQDGIARDTGLLDSWPEGGPPELWRTEGGTGFAGVIVAGGRVHTVLTAGEDEVLVAVEAATGRKLWRYRTGSPWKNRMGDYHGPRAAPTADGGRVYATTAFGGVHCVDAESGKKVWSRDLAGELGGRRPGHGYSMTPLVEDGRVYLNPGGKDGRSFVALDAATGETVWTNLDDRPSYAAPISIDVDGQRQLVFFNATGAVAVAPNDGRELWRYPWTTRYDINAATPVWAAPYLFIASEYDHGSALLRLSAADGETKADEVWVSPDMQNKFASSVLHDGHLYGFHRNFLSCMKLVSGEEKWRQRDFGYGSLVIADGKMIVLGDSGQLALAEISPEGYRQISRVDGILEGRTWTVPVVAEGRLYLRDQQHLTCLDLRADGGS